MADSEYGLGPCEVVYDPDGANVLIDETKGGVKLFFEEKFLDDKTDQSGESKVIIIKIGAESYAEAPVAAYDLNTLNALAVTSKKYTDAISGATAVVMDGKAGADMLQYAKPVVLKPIGKSKKYWVTLFKAIPQVKKDDTYQSSGGIRVTPVRFEAVPEKGKDYRLIMFGDPTALPVADRPFTAGLS